MKSCRTMLKASLQASTAWLGVQALLALSLVSSTHAQTAEPNVAPGAITANGVWQDAATKTCGSAFGCEVEFAAIPFGKTVIATRVSCLIKVNRNPPPIVSIVYLTSTTNSVYKNYLVPVLTFAGTFERIYAVSNEVVQIYGALKKPKVTALTESATATMKLDCQLGGTISP